MDNLRIAYKLVAAFSIIVTVVLAMSCSIYLGFASIKTATRANNASHAILAAADETLAEMVEQQDAVRGYVATNQASFLPRIKSFQAAGAAAIKELAELDTDPQAQSAITDLENEAAVIQTQDGQVIALAGNPATAAQARSDLVTKGRLSAARATIKRLIDPQLTLMQARGAAQARSIEVASIILLAGSTLSVLASLGVGWLLARSIGAPVAAMTLAMGRLAKGDNSIAIPAVGRRDEVGEMANAVQAFKDAAIQKMRLEAEAQAAGARREAEQKEQQQAREAAAKVLAEVVDSLASGLERLASGDLLFRLRQPLGAGYDQLRTDFNATMDRLQDTMRSIAANTAGVKTGTSEINAASDDLARRAEQTAASLEQSAAALDEITAAVRKSAEGAAAARDAATAATAGAAASSKVVGDTIEAMGMIEDSSRQIGTIIAVIDEIAFQTNLLALNAGIEAARAGDSGRGFAVVATEVRALAQRSADAAREIKGLITKSGAQVQNGVRLVHNTGTSLQDIGQHISRLNTLVATMAAAGQEQAASIGEVNRAVNQMDQATQQNAAMIEQTSAASASLATEAEGLSRLVARFQIDAEHAHLPPRRIQAVVPA